jgi:hypothetical protein
MHQCAWPAAEAAAATGLASAAAAAACTAESSRDWMQHALMMKHQLDLNHYQHQQQAEGPSQPQGWQKILHSACVHVCITYKLLLVIFTLYCIVNVFSYAAVTDL